MSNENRKIALVDNNDRIIGYESKMEVHQKGLLHRAFSIFVFNDKGEFLLQKRATQKYHSPGLWTNTCCSHLVEESDFGKYMHERLIEEMGFDCALEFKFSFHYKIEFDNGLTENEIDHVYFGKWNSDPNPNPSEVDSYRWISPEELKVELMQNPDSFTYWFKEAIDRIGERKLY